MGLSHRRFIAARWLVYRFAETMCWLRRACPDSQGLRGSGLDQRDRVALSAGPCCGGWGTRSNKDGVLPAGYDGPAKGDREGA